MISSSKNRRTPPLANSRTCDSVSFLLLIALINKGIASKVFCAQYLICPYERVIFTPYITKNGRRIYASEYGLKAFRITVSR